jgi:hypothetical protein
MKEAIKYAKQDMKQAKKDGTISIIETKLGVVELTYEDGLYQLVKQGAVVFQAYEHTTEVFINNMVTKVYQYV